jgi:drug/metabolite transporter (DMT)-like permease
MWAAVYEAPGAILPRVSRRAWAAFAAMSIIWGTPYLLIKVAVDDGVPPGFLAFVRLVMAAVVLLALAWRAGLLDTLRGRWGWLVVYAVCELALPFPLIAAGEQHVDSSVAAIVIATAPLLVTLLALRFDHAERASGRRLAGLFIGLAGVAALVGVDIAGEPDELLGAAAIGVAALGYAIGPMLLNRKLSDLDARVSMGAALLVAAALLAPLAIAHPPAHTPSAEAIASLVALGLVCTAAALVIFTLLIAEVGPGRALVITYVNPVVAVALGVLLLDERPGPGTLAGLVLILAGSWLATRATPPPPAR